MSECLDFKKASCKNCHKCLRECPVKAIRFENHQAKIIDDRCILCGKCTLVCPQNAKYVHSEKEKIRALINAGNNVIASVAPSFISNFDVTDFTVFKKALQNIGFYDAEETAIGAKLVTEKYAELLKSGTYKNFITSSCPSVNSLIEKHYPNALKYLAKVDSPMVAHAKLIRSENKNVKIVFIGPCIAKKQEAIESGIIDGVLTFEELKQIFEDEKINLKSIKSPSTEKYTNIARYYPINRGIIKSFEDKPEGYEYVAVDGVEKCMHVLDNIDSLSGMFFEMNSCENGCVNGPCKVKTPEGDFKANADVRNYVNQSKDMPEIKTADIDIKTQFNPRGTGSKNIDEKAIKEILAKTGKYKKEDELNCGMCGYSTCREKAWAVYNGYADVEMCLPYMRERAESLSNEVIDNSPNGIVVIDNELKILQINNKAKKLFGIEGKTVKGHDIVDYFNPTDFVLALYENKCVVNKKTYIPATKKYVELSITLIKEHNVMFGIMKDITQLVSYDDKLNKMKMETLVTTDEVIKKQMRVAQEIASLLGETTAETKVALLKLKKTLLSDNKEEK